MTNNSRNEAQRNDGIIPLAPVLRGEGQGEGLPMNTQCTKDSVTVLGD